MSDQLLTQTKDGLRETTARRFRTRMSAPGYELSFESNDPKHTVGIWLPNQESTERFALGALWLASIDRLLDSRMRVTTPPRLDPRLQFDRVARSVRIITDYGTNRRHP
jgi:hypothetical protein